VAAGDRAGTLMHTHSALDHDRSARVPAGLAAAEGVLAHMEEAATVTARFAGGGSPGSLRVPDHA
jgi:hypothetical protein